MLGGQEGDGDQVWFMGSNRPNKMEGAELAEEFSFGFKKVRRGRKKTLSLSCLCLVVFGCGWEKYTKWTGYSP